MRVRVDLSHLIDQIIEVLNSSEEEKTIREKAKEVKSE